MKKTQRLSTLLSLMVLALVVPQIAFAAWWNPFSWKIFQGGGNPIQTTTTINPPIPTPTPTTPKPIQTSSQCNPNYSGCLKKNAGDYDCAGGSGNGPNYTGMVQVIGYDEYGLDRDGDGWACEN